MLVGVGSGVLVAVGLDVFVGFGGAAGSAVLVAVEVSVGCSEALGRGVPAAQADAKSTSITARAVSRQRLCTSASLVCIRNSMPKAQHLIVPSARPLVCSRS
jgi:hypothetical protein